MQIIARVARRVMIRVATSIARERRLVAVAVLVIAGAIAATAVEIATPWQGMAVGGEPERPGMEEPPAIVEYLRGKQQFDAKLMMSAIELPELSPEQVQARQAALQRQLDREREAGPHVRQSHYVGSFAIPDGSLHFYVLTQTSLPRVGRGAIAYVPRVFTLNTRGKIVDVE